MITYSLIFNSFEPIRRRPIYIMRLVGTNQ